MGKKQSQKKSKPATESTKMKGRVVELITASMHELPNVRVETNVFLPVLDNSRRKREIDVLLTSDIAGFPIRMAIECKNEKSPIGTLKIDHFISRLMDVGIPPQLGIFVSASGYKRTAIERAKAAGVKTLTLKGLTKDGFSEIVADAFQAIIFLLADVTRIEVYDEGESTDPELMPFFVDSEGNHRGWVLDLIWQDWLRGKPPSLIGEHKFEVHIPKDIYPIRDGKFLPGAKITAVVQVLGLAITISGKAEQYALIDASTEIMEKTSVNVSFDSSTTQYEVTTIRTEDELKSLLERPEAVSLTQRLRLPRIRISPIYWPPSERVHRAVMERFHAFREGKVTEPPEFSHLEGIEGTDLNSMFEPVWQNHPLIRRWKNKSR